MKTKILIAGIGGVGGYFGGLLAHHLKNDKKVEIYFLARGEHLKKIKTDGLQITHGEKTIIAHPKLATDNAAEIGLMDFVIIATKSYHLESILDQIALCIGKDTLLLPLLNGVDSRPRIQAVFQKNLVLDGCVYIIARRTAPGIVENQGNIQKLFFGLEQLKDERLGLLENLMKKAQIEVTYSDNIAQIIWEKYIFIAAIATGTSYFDENIGTILKSDNKLTALLNLVKEVEAIARAKNIAISENIEERTLKTLNRLPFETTSSMHSDFINKSAQTELDTLTGYIVTEGKALAVETPTFSLMFEQLKK